MKPPVRYNVRYWSLNACRSDHELRTAWNTAITASKSSHSHTIHSFAKRREKYWGRFTY